MFTCYICVIYVKSNTDILCIFIVLQCVFAWVDEYLAVSTCIQQEKGSILEKISIFYIYLLYIIIYIIYLRILIMI